MSRAQHSAKRRVEPARHVVDGLARSPAEVMAHARYHDEIDARVLPGDPLEDGHRTELVPAPLHDERRAGERRERRLISRPRAIGRRDGMTDDRERVGWLAL